MGVASQARARARERLGISYSGGSVVDPDGIRRVAAAESRADDAPSGEFCDHCGLEFEIGYRPDPCIGGYLPGVAHACCGHGVVGNAYVTLGGEPDQCADTIPGALHLRGRAALDYIEEHRLAR